jgi:8-oxo-dGTP pyrophosphatase MutT (NUDIX family)
MIRAAGILILNKAGQVLFLKRGPGGDCPGLWCFPGGRLEDGESAIDAAVRETSEEAGFKADPSKLVYWTRRIGPREATGAAPTPVAGDPVSIAARLPAAAIPPDAAAVVPGEQVDFTTFLLKEPEDFTPVLGPADKPEHVGYAWCPPDQPPEPLHPGCRVALARFGMDELGVAQAMAAGELTSPQHYANIDLFAIRISGTGAALRSEKKDADGKVIQEAELVYRRPEQYLTPEFLARCNGLPVVVLHPDKAVLNGDEFAKRIVGTVFLPYIHNNEVWAIVKIWIEQIAEKLSEEQLSTSPGVLLGNDDYKLKLEDGSNILIEDKPTLVDHIALVPLGVWDKGGPPVGIKVVPALDSVDAPRAMTVALDSALAAMRSATLAAACRLLGQ